ncbi:unnamed protein product (macronuclear) [Paramecium tetraurelia]|uniref:Uncharacterized protein n=1 Tax=Paramecium tetraurelia TaxID=5888 RepID=A0CE71_PARTE|nr:uncharacterized protein GSPATT00037524001 [Paramecium tetraurelia]CAK69088.1 unnamed protein product [Paramecium tetraurelia]|eukprot:XP_001436485.1 hypothetical protein (macronuclear) [Paramecium tetraurelia strain d4-2]
MYNILLLICIITVIQSKLKVIRPQNLINEYIDYSIANFGIIPFGHRLMGIVDVAYPQNGCSDLRPTYGAHFILIERGNCTFVTKVKNAEKAGYQMAIIGNYNDEQMQYDFTMADDGYGYQVSIPSIFIKKKHFDILTKNAQSYKVEDPNDLKIMMLLKFDVVQTDKVSVIFGLNIQNRESFRIIDEYQPYYQQLKNQDINYTLVYFMMSFNDTTPIVNQKDADCICSNRYCVFDPDGYGIGTGKDVVYEILRQTCIFQKYPEKWFSYMDQFNFKCSKPQAYSVCSQQIMEAQGISKTEVQNCFDGSFVDQHTSQPTKNESNAINLLLENQLHIYQVSGINVFPAVLVNSMTYKGQFSGQGIFGEICNSFLTPPPECSSEIEGYQPPVLDQSIISYLLILAAFVVLFFLLGFCLFRKMIKSDGERVTKPQVNEMVSQYIKFYEGKDKQKEGSI